MASEALSVEAGSLALPAEQVATLAQCAPAGRYEAEVRAALAEASGLLEARACWLPLAETDLEGLFPGETPVAGLARGRPRWAFVATIGPALEERVRLHFEEHRYLEALLLDAAGSVAAEAVCDRVQAECTNGAGSARFSPGYCGWDLSGQRRLFELLAPETLGVRLLPSLLMDPLKSVSGLVVAGPAESLRVPVEVCRRCGDPTCTRRGGSGT